MNNAEQKITQEKMMNELMYNLSKDGELLIDAYRALEAALLERPAGEIREVLESDENRNLSIDELQAKADRFTEEGRSKDYEELSPEEYHQIHQYGTEYDNIMNERYTAAINYRTNIQDKVAEVDKHLTNVTRTIEKFYDSDMMKQIKAAYKQAEKQRKAGDAAAKEYAESLHDFMEFYEFVNDFAQGLRGKISDRGREFNDEFNKKREAVIENNKKITAEIEAIREEIKPLQEELDGLELEIERKERKKQYDEEYQKLIARKNELTTNISSLRQQLGQKQTLLQMMPTFDYNFNPHQLTQDEIIDLELDLRQAAPQMSDLENEMKKRTMDAMRSTPRFEYFIDSDNRLVVSIVVNGSTKTKTVGDYNTISHEQISQALRNLVLTVAAGSVGLDLKTVAWYDFRLAHITSEGLEFEKSSPEENDTFKLSGATKFLYEYCDEIIKKKAQDDKDIEDARKLVEDEPEIDDDKDKEDDKNEDKDKDEDKDKENDEDINKNKGGSPEPSPSIIIDHSKGEGEDEDKDIDEPTPEEEVEEEVQEEEVEDKGFKVTKFRKFSFDPKLKAGANNEDALAKNPELRRYHEELMDKKGLQKYYLPIMVGATLLVAVTNPALGTALAFGGSAGLATLISQFPNVAVKARKRKLDKLAEKMGLKVGYVVNGESYEIGLVDPENPTVKLSNEEIAEFGNKAGINAQEELDKIAGNDTRGKGTVDSIHKKADLDAADELFIERYNKLARKAGLKVDTYYFKKTDGIARLIDIDDEILDETVEFTDEVKQECESRHLDNALADIVKSSKYDQFIEARDEIVEDYNSEIDRIAAKDYTTRLLWSFKDRKLSARRDLKPVKFDNLECLYDDLGGINIPKKGKFASWLEEKFVDPEFIVHNDSDERVEPVEEQPADVVEEVVQEDMTVAQPPVNEESQGVEEAPEAEEVVEEAVEAQEQDAALATDAEDVEKSEPINEDNLDISEAILNATTLDRDEFVDETEEERSESVQETMEQEQQKKGASKEDLDKYMEATKDHIEDVLPDLIKTNPEYAEEYVVNHPEYQELYNKITASLNPGTEGLGI